MGTTMRRFLDMSIPNDLTTLSCPPINTNSPGSSQDPQAPGHTQTLPHNIQLTPQDLFTANGYLYHWYLGTLGKHQHFNIEDPALGVHVWNYVRQGGAGEELEAALGVADAGGGRRRHETEEEVEGVHEEVAEFGAL